MPIQDVITILFIQNTFETLVFISTGLLISPVLYLLGLIIRYKLLTFIYRYYLGSRKTLLEYKLKFRKFKKSRRSKITQALKKINAKLPGIINSSVPVYKKKVLFVIAVFSYCLLFINLYIMFSLTPQVAYSYPDRGGNWNDYNNPLEIYFNLPIRKDSVKFNSSPELIGRWDFIYYPYTNLIHGVRFIPIETVYPEERIVVYLTGISPILGKLQNNEYSVELFAAKVPVVTSTTPQDKEENVKTDDTIVLHLSSMPGDFVQWDVKSSPEIDFDVQNGITYCNGEKNSDCDVSAIYLVPKDAFQQDTEYSITVYKTLRSYNTQTEETIKQGETTKEIEFSFTTVKAPNVENFSPDAQFGVLPTAKIHIAFLEPVEKEEVENNFTINPSVDGSFVWEDEQNLTFSPSQDLNYNTEYTVTITKGIHTVYGGTTDKDITFAFKTVGPLQVVDSNIVNNSQNVSVNTKQIVLKFDQQVNHEEIEKAIKISPNMDIKYTWEKEDNSDENISPSSQLVININKALAYSTKYTITIPKGTKGLHGQPMEKDYVLSFTTESNVHILAVPQYYQAPGFTCNVVSTQMVLAYRGVNVSVNQIIDGIGREQPLNDATHTGGNPYNGWVDNYGVYWTAVSTYVSQYRQNKIYRNWSIQGLVQEINNGNPAIIWWQNNWSPFYWKTWTTPDGTQITGLHGMHSEVVVGYVGSADNPTHIIVNDPWRGRRYYTVAFFDDLWNKTFGRTAVVVY